MFVKVVVRVLRTALLVVAAGILVPTALADPAEVSRLLRAGQLAEAGAKADQFLAAKPRDPQLRFLKGLVLTELGKPQDAIAVFNKITEDFPELPEPYNNLAVLYASLGQFDRARLALESAIRTNPSYATAHENLGDVYAKLAGQAYSKALQLDGANTAVPPKLAMIRDLFVPGVSPRPTPVAASARTAPTAIAPAVAAPAVPVAVSQTSAAPASQRDEGVQAAVLAWAAAWSKRDMQAYFAAYGRDFDAPGGRKSWEEERRARIMGKSKISVKLSDLAITVSGDKAKARFRQAYSADGLSANSRKTLDLVKVRGDWLIVRETVGG